MEKKLKKKVIPLEATENKQGNQKKTRKRRSEYKDLIPSTDRLASCSPDDRGYQWRYGSWGKCRRSRWLFESRPCPAQSHSLGPCKYPCNPFILSAPNRTIAIASDFRVDGATLPEIPQKQGVLGSEIAARNRKSLATFRRTLKSQCSIAFSCLGNRCDFWGPRWASQSQIAKIAANSVR